MACMPIFRPAILDVCTHHVASVSCCCAGGHQCAQCTLLCQPAVAAACAQLLDALFALQLPQCSVWRAAVALCGDVLAACDSEHIHNSSEVMHCIPCNCCALAASSRFASRDAVAAGGCMVLYIIVVSRRAQSAACMLEALELHMHQM